MRSIPTTELGSKYLLDYCTFLACSMNLLQSDDEVAKPGVLEDGRYLEMLTTLVFGIVILYQISLHVRAGDLDI